jgi:hypothetical protein
LVTALIRPPVKLPWRTSNGATRTWNSLIASTEIGLAFDWPPGVPEPARPNRSLLTPPSIWMLLKRLFWPATEVPTTCGEVAIRSVKLRPCSGNRATIESEIVIDAPVRPWLMRASA